MTSPMAMDLAGSCWSTLINGVYQPISLELVPTFFHSGGIFRLQYFDQCDRDGPELVYQNEKGGILLRLILDETYMAFYPGGNELTWKSQTGKTMTWARTGCWPDKFGVPSTPLVNSIN
jgi:hypothetical protein